MPTVCKLDVPMCLCDHVFFSYTFSIINVVIVFFNHRSNFSLLCLFPLCVKHFGLTVLCLKCCINKAAVGTVPTVMKAVLDRFRKDRARPGTERLIYRPINFSTINYGQEL